MFPVVFGHFPFQVVGAYNFNIFFVVDGKGIYLAIHIPLERERLVFSIQILIQPFDNAVALCQRQGQMKRVLDKSTYECRGFISVPLEVYENTDEPLSISFNMFGGDFTIR